ncbi:MAG: glycosyltransferase family 2 protein [Candidatus Omnitrophica bacterium]|nr:glycosyltransferase family 2 protein [Candidatus Omnitrophota bacterium]
MMNQPEGEKRQKILVVIPALNEALTISKVIAGVKDSLPEVDILVVDDGSTDETAKLAKTAGARVLQHPFNLGVGSALQTGFKYAGKEGYTLVIQLDADGQHDPVYLPKFIQTLKESGADLVIGSRFLGGEFSPISFSRLFGIKIFSGLIYLATGQRITDPTSGYRGLTARLLNFFSSDLFPQDFPDADLIITVLRSGFKIKEIPVVMKPRLTGLSLHRGLRPLYYIYKMFLSIFVTLFRPPKEVP